MTLLVKDANTTIQPLATEVDGNGNLVPVHAPAATDAQGVSSPVGPQNPLPVVNTAGNAATDGSGAYRFSDLGPGTYRVRLQAAAGAVQTTADPAAGL